MNSEILEAAKISNALEFINGGGQKDQSDEIEESGESLCKAFGMHESRLRAALVTEERYRGMIEKLERV